MGRALGVLLVLAAVGAAADVVWLDGRRERVERVVVKGDRLLLSIEKGMQSVATRRVVRVVGDDGEEIAFPRSLRDGPLEPDTAAALEALPRADKATLRGIQEQLADSMSRAVMDRLVALAEDRKADVRGRAAETLLLMGLKESLGAGLRVALEDPDAPVRRQVTAVLFHVLGALRTEGFADRVAGGLGDRDAGTRATCALVLGRLGDARGLDVLKASCLKSADHHVRESAAEVLAELGDDSGVSVLIGMLSRTRHPAGADLPARIALEEKIRVCELLGKLKARAAVEPLRKAARAQEPELAAAAQRAIDAIG